MSDLVESLPTDWRHLDVEGDVEVRQVTDSSFELRSKLFTITLNSEGFNLYRDQSPQGAVIFSDYCQRYNIQAIPRDDLEKPQYDE